MKKRILFGLAPLFVLLLVMGVYAVALFTKLGNSVDVILKENFRSVVAGQEMKEASERMDSALSFALVGEEERGRKMYEQNLKAFRASLNEKYNSSYNTGSDLDPRKIQGAYGILNARLGIGAPDDKWAVELWSQNLADKYYYQVAFDAPYQYNQIDAFLGAPRTFGVTARVKF